MAASRSDEPRLKRPLTLGTVERHGLLVLELEDVLKDGAPSSFSRRQRRHQHLVHAALVHVHDLEA